MICGLCKKEKPCECEAKLDQLTKLTEELTRNQCMGCQAGWPYVTLVKTVLFHKVRDGYPFEIVRCTKDRY